MPKETDLNEPDPDQPGPDHEKQQATVAPEQGDQGPGCMPAVMAAAVLMGIIGFVTCGFSTWLLFQQRSEMALRTLRGNVIPQIEQGLHQPETKAKVVEELTRFADDLARGKYDDAQAAGAMSRLIRIPIFQWGEIQAIETFLQKHQDDSYAESRKQLSRLQRAVQMGQAVAMDFEDVLTPARIADSDAPTGYLLKQPLDTESVAEVIQRAKLVADRSEVPDELFENVALETIIRDELQKGINAGK